MKILFLGQGTDALEMLQWTASQQEAEIVGVDIIGLESNRLPQYDFLSLDEIYQRVEEEKAWVDLVISYQYTHILKEKLIDAPRNGCINFHPAPLPDYKGRAGCSFAILDKCTMWGCSAHYIDKGIDTGNIIEVETFPFDWRTETCASLKKKTLEHQRHLYKKVISEALQCGRLQTTAQNAFAGKYISTKDMLAAMEITEKDDIDAKVQAFWFPPYEGAYITLKGKRYTLVNDIILNQLKDIC